MNASRAKTAISAAFSAAAARYDDAADLQQIVARRLAARIAGLALPARPRVLEIGCGTGFFTRTLQIPDAIWTVTDISEAMVRHCRPATPTPNAYYAVMDAETPCVAPHIDLICSNLALQWVDALPATLNRLGALLAPGGYLAFSTLGAGTFKEWTAAAARAGQQVAMRPYPVCDALRSNLTANLVGTIEEDVVPRPYGSGEDFLRRLREIGAHRARPDQAPMSAGALRRVLRECRADFTVSYHVLYGLLKRG